MSELARKLAGLRHQAGAAAAPAHVPSRRPVAADPGVASALECRSAVGDAPPSRSGQRCDGRQASRDAAVAQLRKLLNLRPSIQPVQPRNIDRVLLGEELAPGLHCIETSSHWPMPPTLDLQALGQDSVAIDQLLAFDTETTGLAGGTGTRAFMIGAADWQGERLRLRQLYITALNAEKAMLEHFAGWLSDATILVSYNGKSYDRPLLSTRLRLARMPDPLIGRAHIDLLHPVRRRYRGLWPNCRLATTERRLLGVVREDDLPGSEAPAAWLTYLRGGPATKLRRVAGHNAQDLRSLCGVVEWFGGIRPTGGRAPTQVRCPD